jgi:hypothetical protein
LAEGVSEDVIAAVLLLHECSAPEHRAAAEKKITFFAIYGHDESLRSRSLSEGSALGRR